MYSTIGLGVNGSNSTDEADIDNAIISVALLIPGLVTVVINCIVLIGGFTNLRQEPEEWFRLLGLCTCDLICGIVAIIISALTFHPISALSCKLVHILIPTICCSQLFYLLAFLLYDDLVLRDKERNKQQNNGNFLFVFVFVAWFMSLVICSLPVVADTDRVIYSGHCSPEAVFQQTWRQTMIYYATIYFLPLLATNMLFIKLVVILRKLEAKESCPYVQNIEVVPSQSTNTCNTIQEEQQPCQATASFSQHQAWEVEVLKKWSNRMKARELQKTRQGTSGPGQVTATTRTKRQPGKKGKDDKRLWKKLQETVFSQNWKQIGSFEERYRLANAARPVNPPVIIARRATINDSKKSVVIKEQQDKGIPISVLKERHVTLAVILAILDVVSVLRIVVFVNTFLGKADTLQTKVLIVMSVMVGTLLNGVVHVIKRRSCGLLFTSLYQTLRENCCKGSN